MSYVSLMVHVGADRELGGRIGIAADLADRFHARLIGVAESIHSQACPTLQDMRSVLDYKGQRFCKAVGKHDRDVE